MKEVFLHNSKVALISDLHLGLHQHSPQWHLIALDWAKWLRDELRAKGIKDIIFCGDLQHYRDEISVNTLDITYRLLKLWDEFNHILLIGNHDAYYKDRSDINAIHLLSGWSNINVISSLTTAKLFGKTVTFAPWGTDVSTIPISDLIFGHFEIQSFKFNQFTVCQNGWTTKDILLRAPFIITGHFHQRDYREYEDGDKRILYTGNPFQMDFGDMDSTKGYYILDFNDLKFEFFENTLSPKHHKITLSEMVAAGHLTDEVRQKFANNFIKLVIDRCISSDEADYLLKKLGELKPAGLTVDYSFNFSKFNIDDEKNLDLSGVDISTAIEEFVNLLDVPFKEEVIKFTVDLYKRCQNA